MQTQIGAVEAHWDRNDRHGGSMKSIVRVQYHLIERRAIVVQAPPITIAFAL